MKILIPEIMDLPAVAQLQARHSVIYDADLVDDAPRLMQLARGVDAIIVRNRTQVRGPLLEALDQCKVVGRLGVGLDNIDMPGCAARGMQVIPAYGANALSVAEYVIGTAMVLLRGAYLSTPLIAAGTWPRNAMGQRGREIHGKTLGLIGFGSIGQLTATLAKAVGMRVQAHDVALDSTAAIYRETGVTPVSLDSLISSSDVVSLHVPLLDSTRNLINAARLGQMKPGAVLINTARGGIVDESAVVGALKSGQLGAAALDVFDNEPLPASSLWDDCPNLLLTPHIAGVTSEANERVSTLIAAKVLEALV